MRIAHDLNNSLTSIIGNAELIKEQFAGDLPELDDVIRKSREMAQFIDRLQQYARQQPLTTHSLDLNTAIHDFLPIAKSLLGPTIQINLLPADELPPIYMDGPRIDQVLLSILLSCKKEMPSGGRITIETDHVDLDVEFASTHPGARPGTYSRLSITDSSSGMDPKRVARIFDFPTDHVLDSSSLDLPIAYSIVKDLKGYITLESWVGKGTRFDIYIPVSLSTAATPLFDSLSLPDAHNLNTNTDSSLILVADDDPDIQNTIARCVSRVGYKTLFASDGRTALDLYEQLTGEDNQPALLIADLGLPKIDGRALSLTIQERYRKACVLLTSGHQIDINPATGTTPEGFTFLHKPFEPHALLITIERLLKQKGPQTSLKTATSTTKFDS
jgi:CheY-like chemotaxis protein